jgi:hypothetical protein
VLIVLGYDVTEENVETVFFNKAKSGAVFKTTKRLANAWEGNGSIVVYGPRPCPCDGARTGPIYIQLPFYTSAHMCGPPIGPALATPRRFGWATQLCVSYTGLLCAGGTSWCVGHALARACATHACDERLA